MPIFNATSLPTSSMLAAAHRYGTLLDEVSRGGAAAPEAKQALRGLDQALLAANVDPARFSAASESGRVQLLQEAFASARAVEGFVGLATAGTRSLGWSATPTAEAREVEAFLGKYARQSWALEIQLSTPNGPMHVKGTSVMSSHDGVVTEKTSAPGTPIPDGVATYRFDAAQGRPVMTNQFAGGPVVTLPGAFDAERNALTFEGPAAGPNGKLMFTRLVITRDDVGNSFRYQAYAGPDREHLQLGSDTSYVTAYGGYYPH